MFDQPDQDMPHAINVTPAEQEAIERVCILLFYLLRESMRVISFMFTH